MTGRKARQPILFRIDTLRPNGVILSSEDRAFGTYQTLAARCADLRRETRQSRGWDPAFRILEIDRNATPWIVRDITAGVRP